MELFIILCGTEIDSVWDYLPDAEIRVEELEEEGREVQMITKPLSVGKKKIISELVDGMFENF